ncbi:glutamyl-tRNA amidotransferase A subunit [Heterostelium album PN500]|uniref:Glutamyl-tRNA(Gln) amidotransferase subunit A, mitochondrial n=1 Tax=Heterostelium pallidum (strain ATCC 26659 / Pp 5 / PN500) TaxID=670386 RepID=D3BAC1_HETP5|nr:glutamyl-tRNA amidotransferase A subunit [Heterostelium album PN500]EFA81508.1 glutamyl-tRNA amidotransferase A subunit [Heterostelium album PN500]|eukprot:XP_020433625.1 glutamyl-tRNA amidotransferase A subunit [Heterostelium album PN500]
MNSLSQVRSLLVGGRVTSRQLIIDSLNRIDATKKFNAYITLEDREKLLNDADESDKRLQHQQQQQQSGVKRELEGIPIAVKDNFSTSKLKTTCASKILENYIPSFDATVVSRLKEAGAIIVGKTNMDEFAMGSSTSTGHFGASINPYSRDAGESLVAGGSSGGSAVAVKLNTVSAAIGSDTGGSVRQPAAYCGLLGFKPTYGSISRYGMIAFASSLDTPGFFVHNAVDAAILLDVLVGRDCNDSTSIEHPMQKKFQQYLNSRDNNQDMKGLVFGIPTDYLVKEMDPEIINLWRETVDLIEQAGGKVVAVDLPHTKYALPAYYILATSEASSNLARYDGIRYGASTSGAKSLKQQYMETRSEGFGAEVKRRILLGTMSLSRGSYDNYYNKAQQIRRLVSDDFNQVFNRQSVDILITPTTPSGPFKLGDNQDPIDMYINDIMTIPASLAGLPSASIPLAHSQSNNKSTPTPLSLQLIGNRLQDHKVLEAIQKIMSLNRYNNFYNQININ